MAKKIISIIPAVLVILLIAAFTLQSGREFDITDIPFDVMGYLIGIMAFYIIRLEWKRHRMV